MNKFKIILLAGLATVFFTACGGGDDPSATPKNVIGTWDYLQQSESGSCGMRYLSWGTVVIESLDGDNTKIGNITLQGNATSLINGVCTEYTINKIDTTQRGTTSDHYETGDISRLISIDYGVPKQSIGGGWWEENKMSSAVTYTNGDVISYFIHHGAVTPH